MNVIKYIHRGVWSFASGVLALGCLGTASLGAEVGVQGTIQDWQARAVTEFPELGVQDSPFNRLFLEKAALLKEKSPQSLSDPSWPYRLAVRIAEHPELFKEASAGGASSAKGESGGETVEDVAELCVKVIKQRISAEQSKEKLEEWVAGDKVVKVRRVQALLGADAAAPELRPALAGWVKKMLKSPGHNSEEDRLWLQAFLSVEKLQEPVAALVGLDLEEFQFRVLGETESMEFAEAWLSGKPGPFNGAPRGLSAGRVRVLEMVVRNRFQLGGMAVPENFCLETFYAYESVNPGQGFLLLDQFPLAQWPESLLTGSRPPVVRFNTQKKEWVNYLGRLTEMYSGAGAAPAALAEARSSQDVHPGALEQYVLWKSRRMDSVEETIAWMESVSAQFARHPAAVVRDLRRVFPALAYVLRVEAQKARKASN